MSDTTSRPTFSPRNCIFVVHMRIVDFGSSPAIRQTAFWSQQEALTFALRIFKQYCDDNYEDYVYHGPTRRRDMLGRVGFTARHGQSGKRLVIVDVVEVEVVGELAGPGVEVGDAVEQEEIEIEEQSESDDDMDDVVSVSSSDDCTFEGEGEGKVLKVLTESEGLEGLD